MPGLVINLLCFLAGAIFGVIVMGLIALQKLGEHELPGANDSEVGV